MSKGSLFEFAVLYHPKQTKEQHDRGEQPKSVVIAAPKAVLATSEAEVSILAARSVPTDYADKLEDIEIKVRPF